MAATTGGTDFWATLGVDQEPAEETAEQQRAKAAADQWVAGSTDGADDATAAWAGEKPVKAKDKPAAKRPGGAKQGRTPPASGNGTSAAPSDWAAMFSDGIGESEGWPGLPKSEDPPEAPAPPQPDASEPQDAKPQNGKAENPKAQNGKAQNGKAQSAKSQDAEPKASPASNGAADAAPPADPAWIAAERIATSIEARLSETWLEVLMRHTNGDRVLAGRVYQVLRGQHLIGELWLDKRVNEVHVRGTRVTVCAADGVYEVPGFQSQASARKAIAAIKTAQGELGAVVTQVGDTYVVNRPYDTGPGAESLVASGVVTRELLQRVREALQRLEAVTVTGPAARIVVRAFASLIPSGSRVFVGPFTVLPSGCVAAKGPLDADYVTGVRPGAVAEEMAAAGQVGALIANPETQFQPAVRLVVTGRSLAPEKVTAQ